LEGLWPQDHLHHPDSVRTLRWARQQLNLKFNLHLNLLRKIRPTKILSILIDTSDVTIAQVVEKISSLAQA
jgi:hypothetical protein